MLRETKSRTGVAVQRMKREWSAIPLSNSLGSFRTAYWTYSVYGTKKTSRNPLMLRSHSLSFRVQRATLKEGKRTATTKKVDLAA